MNLFRTYRTSLDIEECKRRLRNEEGVNHPIFIGDKDTIRGWAWCNRFTFHWQKYFGPFAVSALYNNCIGKFTPEPGGTGIRFYLGWHPTIIFFLFVIFGVFLGFGGYAARSGGSIVFVLIITFIFMVFFFSVVLIIGKMMAGDDKFRLIHFIKTTFEADEVTEPEEEPGPFIN